MVTWLSPERPPIRRAILAALLTASAGLAVYSRFVIGSDTVYGHFFYIPIVLAALWFRRAGIWVAVALALFYLAINSGFRDVNMHLDDWFRATMFVLISAFIAVLGEDRSRAERDLKKRHKELYTIFEIVRLVVRERDSLDAILRGMVALLPNAFSETSRTQVRIEAAGRVYESDGFTESRHTLAAPIHLRGKTEGCVAVSAFPVDAISDKDPFLPEERQIVELLADMIAHIVERIRNAESAEQHRRQLIHADKMVALGTLVAGVAHEINNPNNFITLNAPTLLDAWHSARPILDAYAKENGDFNLGGLRYSEMREYIERLLTAILDGSKRIRQIVSELKDFARQDTSTMTDPVDLNAVVQSAVALLSPLIDKSTHRFTVTVAPHLPLVKGNAHRLEQVVVNLVQNACQSLPHADAAIEIRTGAVADSGRVFVEVRDEGEGIRPEWIERITDPFFTTRRKTGGTGLGLSVSLGIVRDHEGELLFTSEPGRGTVARVELPSFHGWIAQHTSETEASA